jgi:hypothetical protein
MDEERIVDHSNSSQSGRVTFDDGGCAVWEWRADAEQFTRESGALKLKALQDDSSLQIVLTGEHLKPTAGCDPYNNIARTLFMDNSSAEKRRSLDDLRRLSEQIKRARG